MSDHDDHKDPMPSSSGLTLGDSVADRKAAESEGREAPIAPEPSEPAPSPPSAPDDDDDPVEDAMFSAFIGAIGTGADPNQAFGVAMFEARNTAMAVGIPEDVFDDLTAGFKPIFDNCLGEGMEPRQALKKALSSVAS